MGGTFLEYARALSRVCVRRLQAWLIAAADSKGIVRRIFARHLLLPLPLPPPLLVSCVCCADGVVRREQCNIRARTRRSCVSSCWPNAIPRQNVRTTDLVFFLFFYFPLLIPYYLILAIAIILLLMCSQILPTDTYNKITNYLYYNN